MFYVRIMTRGLFAIILQYDMAMNDIYPQNLEIVREIPAYINDVVVHLLARVMSHLESI
jgi:hypothetical protein